MKQVNVRRKGAVHLCYVESDSLRDVEYEIARLPDERLACACTAWAFNRDTPQTCKHLQALAVAPKGHYAKVQDKRTGKVETFQFRRAFAFGDIPTGR